MIDQFPEILRYHPAYLSGQFGRLESEFAKPESLERKPYKRSERLPEVGDRLLLVDGVTTLIGLLLLLAAALAA